MKIDYELRCSCGTVKHDRTRKDILEWWLEHKKEGNHKMKLLWFLDNKFRTMTEEEIEEFINYIQSGKAKQNDQDHPWGLVGLGHGKPRGLC